MSSPSSSPAPLAGAKQPEKHSSSTTSTRPPSLNQLAARINLNATSPTGTTVPPGRPRLAASVLRTGSTTSLSTTASTIDSMAVNAPSTRSASPSGLSTPSRSTASTPGIPDNTNQGDPLTHDRLEKLNEENSFGAAGFVASPATEKKIKGYKNIPSLDAITARLVKARSLSIDGSAKPPEAEMIEDPKTPGLAMKAPEHPLQYPWTVYHDTKSKPPFTPAPAETGAAFIAHPPESGEYEAGLTVIGEFDTVESFCRYFNWLKPPSKLDKNSNYHLFKSGIKPMWEDEANAKGGKWVLTMKNNPALLDRCWSFLAMALVGEELEDGDEICGAVVSLRSKVDRIQLWTRSRGDVERLNGIGKKLIKLLDVSEADGIALEFQYNTTEERPLPNKFLSIAAMPTTSFRSTFAVPGGYPNKPFNAPVIAQPMYTSSPVTAPGEGAGVGAFGKFGIGIGMGAGGGAAGGGAPAAWRGGKRD